MPGPPGLAVPRDGEHCLGPCCPHSCPHDCCDTEVDRPLHREGWGGLEVTQCVIAGTRCQPHSLPQSLPLRGEEGVGLHDP